ncbi:MAG: hypothetical protein RIA71_15975 [Oceanicaulis sp.]
MVSPNVVQEVDITKPGPWAGVPVKELVAAYREHENRTASPDTFKGMLPYKLRPPLSGRPAIIGRVSPSTKKRGRGNFIQCNACRTEKKHGSGFLALWNGWTLIAGPICGPKRYGGLAEEIAKFNQTERENLAERMLLEFAPSALAWADVARELAPAAQLADRAHTKLMRGLKPVRPHFSQAINEGGVLVLQPPESVRANAPRTLSRRVQGGQFISMEWRGTASKRVERAGEALSAIIGSNTDLAGVKRRVARARINGTLIEMEKGARAAVKDLCEAYDFISDGQEFLTVENFTTLKEWCEHRWSPLPRGSHAGTLGTKRRIGFGAGSNEFVEVGGLLKVKLPYPLP